MKVKELMTPHAVTVDREETVAAAARILSRRNVGALPVTGPGGRLVGMITDRDIAIRCVAAGFDPNLTRVRTIMSAGTVTVEAEETGLQAARTMGRHRVRRLPVTREGKLVGMLTPGDLAAAGAWTVEAAQAFSEVYASGRDGL